MKNKNTAVGKEFKFSNASYKLDKRIYCFLDEYLNDEKLKDRYSYYMFIEEREKCFYISITSEVEKFQSLNFKPLASIGWMKRTIFIQFNLSNLFVADNNDLLNKFRSSDIMTSNNNYNKLWLLIIPKYDNSYIIVKERKKINEILSPFKVIKDE